MYLFGDFDIAACVRDLDHKGVITIPNLLTPETRHKLLAELDEQYIFTPQNKVFGDYSTRQHFSTIDGFPEDSLFLRVRSELEKLLEKKFAELSTYPFSEQLRFNELVAQRYNITPEGISAHRDFKSSINLIALFVLEGKGRFCVCESRAGENPRTIRNRPGDLVLMRGPGFLASDIRPFHFVDRIISRRTIFVLRQDSNKTI